MLVFLSDFGWDRGLRPLRKGEGSLCHLAMTPGSYLTGAMVMVVHSSISDRSS